MFRFQVIIQNPSNMHCATASLTTHQYQEKIALKRNFNCSRVVTGLRFVEKDNMIHMQIMEGQLFMNGRGHLNRWKPLEKFDFDQNTGMYYVENGIDTMTPLSLGVDYGHPETMNLDCVVAPTGYVITGARFRIVEDSIDDPLLGNGPIELQIRVTPFDSVHRKLSDIHQTRWVASQSLR